jgi:hypothetical protein
MSSEGYRRAGDASIQQILGLRTCTLRKPLWQFFQAIGNRSQFFEVLQLTRCLVASDSHGGDLRTLSASFNLLSCNIDW